jgi:ubiquinol-cytochrome c reductase cytochrome b subunit
VCLGLQRKDAETLEHGVETGIIRQLPDGGYTEVLRPVSDEERAVLAAKPAVGALPAADVNGVPAPASTGISGKVRLHLNVAFTETAAAGRGHHLADGHGEDPAAELAGEPPPAGDRSRSG